MTNSNPTLPVSQFLISIAGNQTGAVDAALATQERREYLRVRLAEEGAEVTPDELEGLCSVLAAGMSQLA